MNAISKILNEKIDYGGIMTARYDIIKDMEDKGHTKKNIDFYLFCLDQKKDMTLKEVDDKYFPNQDHRPLSPCLYE